jgi:plastocyanin
MRKLLLIPGTVLVLALAAPALAATKTVAIGKNGFQPTSVSVRAGDTVVWRNDDTRRHQVVANGGAFASPVLAPKKTWGYTFATQGTFRYHDGLVARENGMVRVAAAPAAVTLAATAPAVVYGQETRLQGAVSSRKANETVTIYARPHGQLSFLEVAKVLTTAGGFWAYVTKPTILTVYRAQFKSAASTEATVQVRPKVTLAASRGYFSARVAAAKSFAGSYVVLQRRALSGAWLGVARYKLGKRSGRVFQIPRRKGVSVYRVYLTARQAGPGYVASWSGTQRVRRR